MAMRLASQGIGLEQFLQMTGQRVEDLMGNMREPATEAAKVDLALRAVVVAEGLEVTDDELHAEIAESAEAMGRAPKELRAALETNGQLSSVRIDMAKRKAMDFLVASVELVDPEGHPIDRDLLDDEDDVADDPASGGVDGPEATAIDDAGNTEDDSPVATSADDHHEADPSADEGEQQ
jgi:trigger factor